MFKYSIPLKSICFSVLSLFLVPSSLLAQNTLPSVVKIVKKGEKFSLIKDNKPYYIKGAVASLKYIDRLSQYGANAVRTGTSTESLNKAQSLGLTVLANLPVKAQRNGMDYNDQEAVKVQFEKVMKMVRQFKDHPAVLMWALGNELDFVEQVGGGADADYNQKVWDAVNDLAKAIHAEDPNHPVMTVVGSISQNKIRDIKNKCPDLDLLGINEYGDILEVPAWLRKFGWDKPYAVTEWGPTGFWQVKKTKWKAPIEETSSEKANLYKKRYEEAILRDSAYCLGSYVFYWDQKQERTHTWFGMFDENGKESEAIDVMHYEWTGKWPANRAPFLDSLKINNQGAVGNLYLSPGSENKAKVLTRDPDKDELIIEWEIVKEGTKFPYGGDGEKRPAGNPDLIVKNAANLLTFKTPAEKGPYRLFVYVYDKAGNYATANVPFFVDDVEGKR